MTVREYCNMNVICCGRDASVSEVAALMRHHHVGDVVVVEPNASGERIPVGIITDRDIVVETLALDIDAKVFTAGDLMTSPVTVLGEEADVVDAVRAMRNGRVRRLPLVSRSGALFGIVSADDIFKLLAGELAMMAAVMAEQTVKEGKLRT